MQITRILTVAALILSGGLSQPSFAQGNNAEWVKQKQIQEQRKERDNKKERDHKKDRDQRAHKGDHDRKDGRRDRVMAQGRSNCPPGLVQTRGKCEPRGQVKKNHRRAGEVIRNGNYSRISDPRRYRLEQRPGWVYYRDNDVIYRVDERTQTILAVMNIISR